MRPCKLDPRVVASQSAHSIAEAGSSLVVVVHRCLGVKYGVCLLSFPSVRCRCRCRVAGRTRGKRVVAVVISKEKAMQLSSRQMSESRSLLVRLPSMMSSIVFVRSILSFGVYVSAAIAFAPAHCDCPFSPTSCCSKSVTSFGLRGPKHEYRHRIAFLPATFGEFSEYVGQARIAGDEQHNMWQGERRVAISQMRVGTGNDG